MKRILIKFLCFSLLLIGEATAIFAQQRSWSGYMRRNELSLKIDLLGLGSLPYNSSYDWTNRMGANIHFGIGYTYWFGEHVGLSSGVGFEYLMSKNTLEELESTSHGEVNLVNGDNVRSVAAQMSLNVNKLTDNHTLGIFQIPLLLSFSSGSFYANIGASLAIPVSSHGSYSYNDIAMQVVAFDDIDIELKRPLDCPVDIFLSREYYSNDFEKPLFWMFSADMGFKFHLDACNMIALGVYFNYSFNECNLTAHDASLIGYSVPETISVAPMQSSLVESYRLFNVGLRLAYHLGVGTDAAKRVSVIY